MKRKGLAIGCLAAGLSVLASMSAFAGQWIQSDSGEWTYIDCGWKQDSVGWWYQNVDGSYPASTWQWINEDKNNESDSELACYYFDDRGYLVVNTTVDGYTVDADGAWTVDGVVQVQLEAWKQAELEKKQEVEARGQQRLYNENINPYVNDPEYQTMREEMFADVNDLISRGRINPKGETIESRRCSAVSESIVYSSSEKEHYWDMAGFSYTFQLHILFNISQRKHLKNIKNAV